jgi:hypothetical protein
VISFVNRHLRAPPRETVTIQGHEVKCSCGCLWIAAPDWRTNPLENRCPECSSVPYFGRVGPLQPVTVTIPIAFRGACRIPR